MSPTAGRRAGAVTALAAVGLLALALAMNMRWVRANVLVTPPPWDQGLYLFLSLRYLHAWQDGGVLQLVREAQTLGEPQAPLLPLSALPLYAVFGDHRLVAYAASSIYGGLLLGATALLALRRAGHGAALLALLLGGCFSAPLLLARDFQMDLPAAALLALAVVALERTEAWRRRGWSAAVGLLAGSMALAKTMAAPFVVAPALYALAPAWRTPARRRAVTNMLLATGLAAGLASWWWLPHLQPVLRYLLYYGWGAGAAPYDPTRGASLLGLRNLTYYVVAFANEGASVAFFVMALVLLVREARRRLAADPRPPLDGLLWTWLLSAYVLLTIARNKAPDRYVVFLIPPAVVLMTTALLRQPVLWRRLGVAAVLAAGGANYVAHTWPERGVKLLVWRPPLRIRAYTARQTLLRTPVGFPEGDWPAQRIVTRLAASRSAHQDDLREALLQRALAPPRAEPEDQARHAFRALLRRDPDPEALRLAAAALRDGSHPLPDLVSTLAASPEAAVRPLRVLVVPDHPYVNAATLRYQAEWSRAPVTFAGIESGAGAPELEDYDAVVIKTGAQGPAASTTLSDEVLERLRESRFRQVPARLPCPDESDVRLYLLGATRG